MQNYDGIIQQLVEENRWLKEYLFRGYSKILGENPTLC